MLDENKPEEQSIPEHEEPKLPPPLEQELTECKDKYLRLLAESENARKRMQKEKQEMTRFAVENVLLDILTPMDNLENALSFAEQMSEETRKWAMGFKMILSQFKDVLQQNNISAFESKGTLFDPHKHEAVETVETDEYPPGTIMQEFVRGYRSGDRIIRHARVKVAKECSKTSETQEQNIT